MSVAPEADHAGLSYGGGELQDPLLAGDGRLGLFPIKYQQVRWGPKQEPAAGGGGSWAGAAVLLRVDGCPGRAGCAEAKRTTFSSPKRGGVC